MNQKVSVAALGLPVNRQGQFLVTNRNDRFPETNNKWQVAGGGLEFGETPEETTLRELREELGVNAKIICPHPVVWTQTWNLTDVANHLVLITFIVDIGDQPITLNQEADRYEWVTVQTLDVDNCLPATKPIIDQAEKLVNDFGLVNQLS